MIKRCVITITLLLRIALASAVTVAEVTPPSIGVERADLNPTVPACADFYEFANGSWRTHNPIPYTMQRWLGVSPRMKRTNSASRAFSTR